MASSPERISSGASATAATARRPMASRTLASTSAGPAVCKITSSAPHSALTAARPPSVTIANSGQSRPVVCSSRQILFGVRQVAPRVHQHRVRGRGLDQGGRIGGQHTDRVQQEPEARAGPRRTVPGHR